MSSKEQPERKLAVLSSRAAYADRQATFRPISHGLGPFLFDASGQRFFDAAGGSGSLILGHGDLRLAEALAEQAKKLTVFPGRHMAYELVETYAARLVEFAPPGICRAIVYSSGSDAVEAAMKLAIQSQRARGMLEKVKVIGREASYHGNTLMDLSAGGFIRRRKPYEAALPGITKAAPAHCPGCVFGLRPDACALECAASIEHAILAEGPETVAAFIAEPVVGAALSAGVPDDRYFARVREICDRYDVFLIADEVMTGFGRTGRRFAIEHWGVQADIIVAGKAISAGYFPLSALLVHECVATPLETLRQPFENGQTHACSPLGSAVGLHVLDRIESEGLVFNAQTRGAQLQAMLRAELMSPWIGNIRGLGLMIGLDLIDATGAGPTPRVGLADLFQRLAMSQGLIVYSSSGSARSEAGEHFLLLPPLNIEDHHVQFMVDALARALRDLDRLGLSRHFPNVS